MDLTSIQALHVRYQVTLILEAQVAVDILDGMGRRVDRSLKGPLLYDSTLHLHCLNLSIHRFETSSPIYLKLILHESIDSDNAVQRNPAFCARKVLKVTISADVSLDLVVGRIDSMLCHSSARGAYHHDHYFCTTC